MAHAPIYPYIWLTYEPLIDVIHIYMAHTYPYVSLTYMSLSYTHIYRSHVHVAYIYISHISHITCVIPYGDSESEWRLGGDVST